MADKRCFVQFPHPGDEHKPDRNGKIGWNQRRYAHKRKFMQFRGEWIDEDGGRHRGDLRAWGEWEPESELIRRLHPPKGSPRHPRYLWKPYWVPRSNYEGLHDTDPFIFDNGFLYSNCGQSAPNKRGLKRLAAGSVIAFGSCKKIDGTWNWVLDTVLVVRNSCLYEPRDPRESLEGKVSDAFLDVTGGPLSDNDGEPYSSGYCAPTSEPLRLYRGATPDDPVDGMFSFFPAIPADGESSFARPVIQLSSEHLNPGNLRAPKGHGHSRQAQELRGLWDSLVKQVRKKQLVLGTHAAMPEPKSVGRQCRVP